MVDENEMTEAVAGLYDALLTVTEAAGGHRAAALRAGFDEETANTIALSAYGVVTTRLFAAIIRSDESV